MKIKKIGARVILGSGLIYLLYHILTEPAKEFGWITSIFYFLIIAIVISAFIVLFWKLLDCAFSSE